MAGGGGGLFLGCEGLPGLLPAGSPVSGGFGLACAVEAEAGAGGVLHGGAVLGPAAGLGEVGFQGDLHAGGGREVFDGAVERWCGLVAEGGEGGAEAFTGFLWADFAGGVVEGVSAEGVEDGGLGDGGHEEGAFVDPGLGGGVGDGEGVPVCGAEFGGEECLGGEELGGGGAHRAEGENFFGENCVLSDILLDYVRKWVRTKVQTATLVGGEL